MFQCALSVICLAESLGESSLFPLSPEYLSDDSRGGSVDENLVLVDHVHDSADLALNIKLVEKGDKKGS